MAKLKHCDVNFSNMAALWVKKHGVFQQKLLKFTGFFHDFAKIKMMGVNIHYNLCMFAFLWENMQ